METFFFRNPRLFALVIGMIVVLGASSYQTIGRQEDPTITNLFANMVTAYPGADPERVEALVTRKLEDELKTIPEISEINATSRTGLSFVSIELSSHIADEEIEQVWSEVRDAISDARVNMPDGVGGTQFENDSTGAFTTISSITLAEQGSRNFNLALRYARILQDRLRRVGGTEKVEIYGAPEEQIYVELDNMRLDALGLSVLQVADAVRRADAKVVAGRAQSDGSDLLVEVAGEIKTTQRVAQIPVVSQQNGQQILLGDIAEIFKGVEDPLTRTAYSNGETSVLVAARMEPDLRVDAWNATIDEVLTEFENDLPENIRHEKIFSQNDYTQARLSDVFANLAIGVSLVVGVLFLTLGFRSALVVAVVLPLTSLGSITILQFLGVPIHQMSVTGLIVALGLLVDAAIVMTDDIGRRIREGESTQNAIKLAVVRLRAPLFASTFTTALAFMPMALLPGPAGDFVGSIAISVIVMLVMSFLLAIFITPAIAGWVLSVDERERRFDRLFAPVAAWFRRSVRWSLTYPLYSVVIACLIPVSGFLAFPVLTAQFFPGVDRNQFYIQVDLNNGSALAQTDRTVQKIDAILAETDGIANRHWVVGENAPPFYYNMLQTRDNDVRFAEALITTTSPAVTESIIPTLQHHLDAKVPEAQVLVRGLFQGPPVNAPVEFKVIGPNLETLRRLGEEVRTRMARVQDITHTRVSLDSGTPKVVFDLDERKVEQAGYRLTDVAAILNASLTGVPAGSLLEGTEEIPITVRLAADDRQSQSRYAQLSLPVQSTGNQLESVPLSSLGDIDVKPGKSPILRQDGERLNTVQGFIRRGVLPEEALKQMYVQLEADPIELPPGYRIQVGGDSDARSETTGNLMSSVGLIIALTVATIVITFNSYRLSGITFIVCLLSAGLSLFSLAVFQFPFGIQALIGVIGSIGVSINAALIVLTALKANEEAASGDREAGVNVVINASRHIVSTTVTTFGGFLPLLLAGGGFWPPFAMAIAGGVLLSTIVSFYFTPPMFYLWYAGRPRMELPKIRLPKLPSGQRIEASRG